MGKPYAVAAIITMVIGSGYILYTSGLVASKMPTRMESEIAAPENSANVPTNIKTETVTASKEAEVKLVPSIEVVGYVKEGSGSIDLQYKNLMPGAEYSLTVCVPAPATGCTEWVESFTPTSQSGEYKMTAEKAFGTGTKKSLSKVRSKIIV